MRELSGLEFAEIGAAFGTSAAVARQTVYEARINLRQLEEGRERHCTEVMRELSEADGRTIRRREIRAHLRACPDCRAFQDEIARRRGGARRARAPPGCRRSLLRARSLQDLGGGGDVAAGGGLGGAAGCRQGDRDLAVAKSAATVAVVAVVGVSAADRAGWSTLPSPAGAKSGPEARGMRETTGPVTPIGTSRAAAKSRQATTESPGGTARRIQPRVRSDRRMRQRRARDGRRHYGGDRRSRCPAGTDVQSTAPRGRPEFHPAVGPWAFFGSRGKGRPDQPTAASAHGQQTAAAHKPAQAASPPGPQWSNPRGDSRPASEPSPRQTRRQRRKYRIRPQAPPATELPAQAKPAWR